MDRKTVSLDERLPLQELDANAVAVRRSDESENANARDEHCARPAFAEQITTADVTPARTQVSVHDDIFSTARVTAASSCSTSVASCSSPTAATAPAGAHPASLNASPKRASPRKRPFTAFDDDSSASSAFFKLTTATTTSHRRPAPSSAKGKERDLSLYTHRVKQRNFADVLDRRMLGLNASFEQISLRSYLRDFVSHNESQVFRTVSQVPHSNFSTPFALAFSHAAKAGSSKQIVASSSNEGIVTFLDAAHDNEWDAERTRHSFRAHNNAVFDVTWSLDDRLVSTASGDQTAKLHDVETGTCVAVLAGHECTVKSVAWDPYNEHLLSTAARDGNICVWDRRVKAQDLPPAQGPTGASGPSGSCIGTVNVISNAHLPAKSRAVKNRSNAAKSVTSVAYLPQSAHHLVSSGSADSMIKIWDLRKAHSRSTRPRFEENNEEALAELVGQRPHGISHMKISPNGHRIYALSTDSRIHAFDAWNLSYPSPLATYEHPQLISSSFYVRLSISPDSRFLACGSVNGGLYLWDTMADHERGVRLVGHTKEICGVDWGHDVIATCSDDLLIRTWNVNRNVASRKRSGEEVELGWRWSGEDEDARKLAHDRKMKP